MKTDPKITDLQKCNAGLGEKYLILKKALEQIVTGTPFYKDIATDALSRAKSIEVGM